MAEPVRRHASFADLVALPPNVIGEVIAGVLHTQPRPSARHAYATSGLGSDLIGPFQRGRGGPGGWIILDEPELHLGPAPDIVVPDLAGWRRTRMPQLLDTAHVELAPDWICEATSPSTAARDRTIKLDVYRRERVPFVWFLDPRARMLEVLRLDGETYRLAATYAGASVVRAEPFDAIELDLSQLWLDEPEDASG